MIAVHVTHEAVEKMGGIGAVIAGLVTSTDYQKTFERTVLVGPLLTTDHAGYERFGPDGKVLYSSLDGIDTADWTKKFRPVEQAFQVGIVYGTRLISDGHLDAPAKVEVLLVDVFRCNADRLNAFKGELFRNFSIPSDDFEHIWEYEQYVRLAEPALEAMGVIGCISGTGVSPVDKENMTETAMPRNTGETLPTGRQTPVPRSAPQPEPVVLFSHEYMGLPMALKTVIDKQAEVRTVFYAHEAASVRRIVETQPGHDLMFYNLLAAGEKNGSGLEDFFPEIRGFYKHPLIKAARHCDAIFAVGDFVGREMQFLDPAGGKLPVEMVYNGVPAGRRQDLAERQEHRGRMKQYAENLFGFEPDYIFTHVARPVLSKGIWRDLSVLHELDGFLVRQGRSAVYFMLGTLAGRRSNRDILQMECDHGWPVHHWQGYPDMCNGEEVVGELFEDFNQNHKAVRVVLVNQFGWEQERCGRRMPEDMTFADIRKGTDAEFGLSVYEPFGISQLEPLWAGAICVVSNVCGCVGLVQQCTGGKMPINVLVGDFIHISASSTPADAMQIDTPERDAVEAAESKRIARRLAERLPKNEKDIANLLETGAAIGQKITWGRMVADFFGPAVERVVESGNNSEKKRATETQRTQRNKKCKKTCISCS